MSDNSQTTRQDVLLSILMALMAAWGIYFSNTQEQSAACGFFCGSSIVFVLADYRRYLEEKLHELQNGTTPPTLSDEAWKFLKEQSDLKTDDHMAIFEGDWGNWNWIFFEMYKRSVK